MTTLLSNRQVRRRGILFVVLLALTLLCMAISSSPAILELQRGFSFALRPVQAGLASAAATVRSVAAAVAEIDALRVDNAALRDENERLRNDLLRLEVVRRENDQLTALLQLQGGFEHETVATRVIGREMLSTRRIVTLDKGADAGIEVGDVVVVQGGALAGRITDVGANFSRATLVSDASVTVVGQLLGSGATGDITGQAGGVLVMRNIDSAVTIGIDEEVFTAGIELAGGIRSPYPRGLVIGTVVDVERDANAVVQTAFLAPAATLDAFELVLVITSYDGGLPPVEEQPVPCPSDGTLPDGEVPCYTPTPAPADPTPAP